MSVCLYTYFRGKVQNTPLKRTTCRSGYLGSIFWDPETVIWDPDWVPSFWLWPHLSLSTESNWAWTSDESSAWLSVSPFSSPTFKGGEKKRKICIFVLLILCFEKQFFILIKSNSLKNICGLNFFLFCLVFQWFLEFYVVHLSLQCVCVCMQMNIQLFSLFVENRHGRVCHGHPSLPRLVSEPCLLWC